LDDQVEGGECGDAATGCIVGRAALRKDGLGLLHVAADADTAAIIGMYRKKSCRKFTSGNVREGPLEEMTGGTHYLHAAAARSAYGEPA
jgi:hypothetical protein